MAGFGAEIRLHFTAAFVRFDHFNFFEAFFRIYLCIHKSGTKLLVM